MSPKRINLSEEGNFYDLERGEYLVFKNKHLSPAAEEENNSFMSSLKEKDSKLNIGIFEDYFDDSKSSIIMLNGFEVNIILTIEDEEQDLLFVPASSIIASLNK